MKKPDPKNTDIKMPLTFLEILRMRIKKMEGDISPRQESLLFKKDLVQRFLNIL